MRDVLLLVQVAFPRHLFTAGAADVVVEGRAFPLFHDLRPLTLLTGDLRFPFPDHPFAISHPEPLLNYAAGVVTVVLTGVEVTVVAPDFTV